MTTATMLLSATTITAALLAGVFAYLYFTSRAGTNQASMPGDDLRAHSSQAQRLEAMGRLAGGIAHDFNNLLTVIAGHAELLEDDVPEEAKVSVEAIQDAAARAATLTGHLLAFGGRQRATPEAVNVASSLNAMAGQLRGLVTEDGRLSIEVDTNHDDVLVDPSHLDKIMTNLVMNACEAIEANGSIGVSSRGLEVSEARSREFPSLDRGRYVAIEVRDDGVGMDEETMTQAFEPLFTTKAKGQGTGLGLATVYGLIEQAGGAIRIQSEVGEGSSFEFALPCSPS